VIRARGAAQKGNSRSPAILCRASSSLAELATSARPFKTSEMLWEDEPLVNFTLIPVSSVKAFVCSPLNDAYT